MEKIMEMLPVILPLGLVQLALMAAALVHILTHKVYKAGNRTVWIVVAMVVSIIGPILYFVFGRSDEA